MKLKDIFSDIKTKVFVVTDQSDEDELNWNVEPTEFHLIPEDENYYFVKKRSFCQSNIRLLHWHNDA
jgi:hypothetical protein